MTDIEEFTALTCSLGFRLKSKVIMPAHVIYFMFEVLFNQDDHNTHFTLFEFNKVARSGKTEKEWGKLLSRGVVLKPCEYKRR